MLINLLLRRFVVLMVLPNLCIERIERSIVTYQFVLYRMPLSLFFGIYLYLYLYIFIFSLPSLKTKSAFLVYGRNTWTQITRHWIPLKHWKFIDSLLKSDCSKGMKNCISRSMSHNYFTFKNMLVSTTFTKSLGENDVETILGVRIWKFAINC